MLSRSLLLLSFSALSSLGAEPSLTVYNQNFAVVRETLPLDLKRGVNNVRYTGTAAFVEPESVILRDPAGKHVLRILEQNYRADPVSVERLLSLYEGKTIEFLVAKGDRTELVSGRIIRSGYVPGVPAPPIGQPWYGPPPGAPGRQPVIEVEGKLRFLLPGIPLFPALADEEILKPTAHWLIDSDRAGKLDAELSYITGEVNWEADYNFVAASDGDALDLTGWVTMKNYSGKTFENARIKLMAGDVNKLRRLGLAVGVGGGVAGGMIAGVQPPPLVTQKSFDEYHLYTLEQPATLRDGESKQVEFVRASGVKSRSIYVYDGARIDPNRYAGWNMESVRNDPGYGVESNPKVWVMREFANSEANRLGLPLPKGKVRFYRRDGDGRLEFTGEDTIDHTPRDETVRVFTGAAFDLAGERRRLNFRIDHSRMTLDESFEIKVRNHKKEAVEVRVVEHLYRWNTWEIQLNSSPFAKTDSQTIEFRLPLQPGEEKAITYLAHYTW